MFMHVCSSALLTQSHSAPPGAFAACASVSVTNQSAALPCWQCELGYEGLSGTQVACA